MIVSVLAGLATLGLVYLRRFEPARYTAAVAVAAIIAGLGARPAADAPAGPHDQPGRRRTRHARRVVVAVLAGGAILFPSLALLFRLALRGRFQAAAEAPSEHAPAGLRDFRPRLLIRISVACLIAGFGLLTVADAGWAHAIGVVCLFAFVITGFGAIVSEAFATELTTN